MMFITSTFIYVSLQIKNQISSTDDVKNNIISYFNKESKLDQKEVVYSDNESLELLYFDNFITWLKKDEEIVFSWTTNTWTLTINTWWPIYYNTSSSSWIITSSWSIAFNWNLNIKNLWWFTNFSVYFATSSWLVLPYNYYKINKTIWSTILTKEFWKY